MWMGQRIYRSAFLACFAAFLSLPGLAQSVTVSPTSVPFGNQVQGIASSVHKVTLKNGQSTPPEPEAPDQLDAHPCIGYAMASSTACAPSLSGCSLRRHPSKIRTGCANQRPSGSVRGATRNGCPYRARQLSDFSANFGKASAAVI
jgi:hypothetical protein